MVFAGFWGFLITSRSSVQIRPPPLKPRCRIHFDPGGFSCADGETSTKSHQYPKSSQQLALSDVLCRLPLSKNRDTAKRRSRVDSVPKNALCLSKTQRHSPRVKTLVGFTVNSWNSNSTSGVMRPWGYGPKIEGRCSWQSGSLEHTTARSKINHIVVEFKREGMIHPYSRRRLGWQSLQIDCVCLPASKWTGTISALATHDTPSCVVWAGVISCQCCDHILVPRTSIRSQHDYAT